MSMKAEQLQSRLKDRANKLLTLQLNKLLFNIKISVDYKEYVKNYIIESIRLMDSQGFVEEFVCEDRDVIQALLSNKVITRGFLNTDNILIPIEYYNESKQLQTKMKYYMISDEVLSTFGQYKLVGSKN